MKVFTPEDQRFDVALELLREGKSFSIAAVSFWIDHEHQVLDVSVATQWKIENLTMEIGAAEIEKGKEVLAALLNCSSEFEKIVRGLSPRFSLIHDYHTGSVEVGYLMDDKLIWKSNN
jgi:hypothetical protein